ncbi:SAM-dependent methyltransferase [Rickettsiales bacterium]|nr:SAM-dependent methyltransferase [Rickettsiales bacterium]
MTDQLSDKIINNININGPISVGEFMQICLFDPDYGYYVTQDPFGNSGDFVTSPEISQCFGEIIALYCLHYCQDLPELQIIELGPGRGVLMQDMLRVFRKFPDFYNKITIHMVEISPRLRTMQAENLTEFELQINHYDEFSQIPIKPSFIISNELLDCLPMQQFQYQKGRWLERKLNMAKELHFVLHESASCAVVNKFLTGKNQDGDIFEFSLSSMNLIKQIAEFVTATKSRSLIIDYGYTDYNFKPTLQALKGHKYQNVFKNIGNQDLTYLVNFKMLCDSLKEQNCHFSITAQGEFLLSLGIKERIDACKKGKNESMVHQLDMALNRLTAADQMGKLFKVLELAP